MLCNRCPQPLGVYRTSWFNMDNLCEACQKSEEKHPDYGFARRMETVQVSLKNFNYEGVGWPGEDGRVNRKAIQAAFKWDSVCQPDTPQS